MEGGALHPKATYRPKQKLEVFFTGGAARITRDGKLLACACGEEVKASTAAGRRSTVVPAPSCMMKHMPCTMHHGSAVRSMVQAALPVSQQQHLVPVPWLQQLGRTVHTTPCMLRCKLLTQHTCSISHHDTKEPQHALKQHVMHFDFVLAGGGCGHWSCAAHTGRGTTLITLALSCHSCSTNIAFVAAPHRLCVVSRMHTCMPAALRGLMHAWLSHTCDGVLCHDVPTWHESNQDAHIV